MAVAITRTADPASTTVSVAGSVGTYSAQSIGTASTDRIIALCVGTEVASGTIDSATIDYGSGDIAMKEVRSAGSVGNNTSKILWAAAPTGTTATFKITFGATPTTTNQHITVYAVTGAYLSVCGHSYGSTDMDSSSPLIASYDPGSVTTNCKVVIPTNGGFIGCASCGTNGTGKTWVGATEDLDADIGSVFRWTTATSTTGANATITCTGGTNGEDGNLAFAIFCPNNGLFGDLKAVSGRSIASIVDPFSIRVTVPLAVGDLVFVNYHEQTGTTAAGVTDDLGHTGIALVTTTTASAYYYVVTVAGNATISVDTTASTHDAAVAVAVYAGPFATSPLDKNPAYLSDSAEAYSANATGTLSQADELIIGYFGQAASAEASYDTPSPGNLDVQVASNSGVGASAAITSLVVSATTTQTMTLSGSAGNVATNCGVATFKKELTRDGVGASAGTSTAPGISSATKAAGGLSAGTSTVLGISSATKAADASSAGTSTAIAVGDFTAGSSDAVADAAGTSTVLGISAAAKDAAAATAGVATVLGISAADKSAVANTAGTSTVAAVSAADKAAVMNAAGVGTAAAISSATAAANASSAGVATVSGISSAAKAADASSTGVGTVSGISSAAKSGDAASAGVATVLGISAADKAAVMNAAGTSTADAVGAFTSGATEAVALAAGTSTADAVSAADKAADGNSAGTSTALAVGEDATPATTPAVGFVGIGGGARMRGGPYPSRKKLLELYEAWRDAKEKAADLKNGKAKRVLVKAIAATADVIDDIEAEIPVDVVAVTKLTNALEAAAGAARVSQVALDAHKALIEALAIQAQIEDDEEAYLILAA